MKLDLSNQGLTEFPCIQSTSEITLLDLSYNHLFILPEKFFERFPQCKYIYLNHNQLTSLPSVSCLHQLEELIIDNNLLTSIPELPCPRLHWLSASSNQLTYLPSLIQCISLQILDVSDNRLSTLPSKCVSLEVLFVQRNQLTMIPDYPCLKTVCLYDNPLLSVPYLCEQKTIYNDPESVHDSGIQQSVCEALDYLKNNVVPCDDDDIDKIHINNKESLLNSIQSMEGEFVDGWTLKDVVRYVWAVVRKNPTDLLPIFEREIVDMKHECLSGMIAHCINTLSGVVEGIHLQISESAQLSCLALLTKSKIVPYDEEIHRVLFEKEMRARGYDDKVVKEWICF